MDHLTGSNETVAARLREAGALLEAREANPFRVAAYRRAADTVARLDRDLADILRTEGRAGLVALPAIGRGIAAAIEEMLTTGRWTQLDRLRADLDPARLLATVPGIGPVLARRLHEMLGVESLEALEVAAHDGRLDGVPGVGPRRAAAIRALLASRLARRGAGGPRPAAEPTVGLLLDVDREYREAAAAGRLPTIAPRRFNPERTAWLPILHSRRGPWRFTALFSNTALAHARGRTRDWVVVYFTRADHEEGQRTVVTETRGPLAGRRVVRGRERECEAPGGTGPERAAG